MWLDNLFDAFPTLTTPRLRLRRITPADAEDIYRIFSDDEVLRYDDVDPFASLEYAVQFIHWVDRRFEHRDSVRWGLALRSDDRVIGTLGFPLFDDRGFRAVVGYELNRDYWRRGFMSEALQAAIRYAFTELNVNRIEALVLPQNRASIGLLEKTGFQQEGLLREYAFFRGSFHDHYLYSLLKKEHIAPEATQIA